MQSSYLDSFVAELTKSAFLRIVEPEIIEIRGHRIGQSRYISTKLAASEPDSFIAFPNKYGRKTTIAGIWMFLEKPHKNEFLITAFGNRKGVGLSRPAQYEGIHICHGAEHNVGFSPMAIDYVRKHSQVDNAEILIFHNHPLNFLSSIFEKSWLPLPSTTDRETLYAFQKASLADWISTGNFKRVRFFLVENRSIHEFVLPPIERFGDILTLIRTYGDKLTKSA